MADLLTRLCRKYAVRPSKARAWINDPASAPRLAQAMMASVGIVDPAPSPPAAEEAPPATATEEPARATQGGEGMEPGVDDSGV